MAEVEEHQFSSLAERIAALNEQKNFSSTGKRPPPQTGRPKSEAKVTNGNRNGNGNDAVTEPIPLISPRPQKREIAPALPRRTKTAEPALESPPVPGRRAPPPLPGRTNTNSFQLEPSPALPPRRPSTQMLGGRRGSNASDMSHISNISNLSLNPVSSHTSATSTEIQPTRRLPPTLDQANLPPLPPTRKEREAQAARESAERPLKSIKSAPVVPQIQEPPRPSLPPRLPSRPVKSPNLPPRDATSPVPPRRLPPPPANGYVRPNAVIEPRRLPSGEPDTPPPVPVSSRPSLSQIDAVATRAATNAAITCLTCRDFSGPDAIAAQYPMESLDRKQDPVSYLANVLCGPFSSATDKARAVFTWCHHNIAYNVEEFFGNCIKGRSVAETIFCGKAVCQGYAEVYAAIAQRAGLQCVLVSGHGKGFGYKPLAKGQTPPPRLETNHAWNAVCIDNGEWKLLDACWGAGNVKDDKRYEKKFKPDMFTLSNDFFGLKHYPADQRYFFRKDSRVPTWKEYMLGPTDGEPAQWLGTGTEEGLSEFTFSPAQNHIRVYNNDVVRFQFAKLCEHWIPEKHGKGKSYLLLMKTFGVDGRKEALVPLKTNGSWWWTDIEARSLGAPGQTVFLYAMTTLNNKDARGATEDDYFRAINGNGYSMAWAIYAKWELVE